MYIKYLKTYHRQALVPCSWPLWILHNNFFNRENFPLGIEIRKIKGTKKLSKKSSERNKMQVKELQMTSLMERGLSGEVKDFYTKFQLHFLNEKWGKVGLRNSEKMVKTQNFPPGSRISIGPKKKKVKSAEFLPMEQIEEILLNINCRLEKENHLENRNHGDSSLFSKQKNILKNSDVYSQKDTRGHFIYESETKHLF